ncbi:3D domain-containing protein [Alkaliphilus serpentinus]|uniref:DUF348 domain-containing protein n=1 Tax=Alkaliphilus serpentinus TaxID=1482731 RepID=A0A833MES5_9FIRM|nr:3D domain-containing protein [Alkaliphilus serpentinus]KAB3531824.1 DUF348 domain-containing protein [Alkaliphilus serpentinus]
MQSIVSSNRLFNKKILIAAMVILLVAATIIVMKLNKHVVIAFDGQEVKVMTFAKDVEGLLKKEGIEFEEEDKIIPGLQERLVDGTRIVIHRAFDITLVDGGYETQIRTAESTIKDLLSSQEIKINPLDEIEPALTEELKAGEIVTITRREENYIVEEQEVPFHTVTKYSDTLNHGETRLIQDGENGLKEIKIKISYEDGIEVAREVVEETIHKEAIDEIVEKGTLNYIVSSRGEVTRYKEVIVMEASAYDAGFESTGKNPGDPYYGLTRSGTKVRRGVVAVDPKVIPLGTKLYVESMDGTASYGYAVAEDTGGAIKGNKIDLFMEDRSEALKFGRRKVKVYILE